MIGTAPRASKVPAGANFVRALCYSQELDTHLEFGTPLCAHPVRRPSEHAACAQHDRRLAPAEARGGGIMEAGVVARVRAAKAALCKATKQLSVTQGPNATLGANHFFVLASLFSTPWVFIFAL